MQGCVEAGNKGLQFPHLASRTTKMFGIILRTITQIQMQNSKTDRANSCRPSFVTKQFRQVRGLTKAAGRLWVPIS